MSANDFLKNQGQTSPYPLLLEVDRAEGSYIYDKQGKRYLDMISGIGVSNLGHGHPHIVEAIKKQADRHLHVMVYGEFVQDEPLKMAQLLTKHLPQKLNQVYPVNSGTEAIEAAMKLVKRSTGRAEIIAFEGCYHGSTQGSLSLSSNDAKQQNYRPLLPGIHHIQLNNASDLRKITTQTAGVFLETIQGDAGVRIPNQEYLKALRKRCDETGTLLVFDEIQCGMGRTGKLFAFEHFKVVPDILCLGKALGGGLPIGALISDRNLLKDFTENPNLGHITTFGGHPLVSASARASLEVLEKIDWSAVEARGKQLEEGLSKFPQIKAIRRKGLMLACDMQDAETVNELVLEGLQKGIILFWFLSHPYSFRLAPPLTISSAEVDEFLGVLADLLN